MWFEKLADDNELSLNTGDYASISGKAVFNANRSRRYFLEKRWAPGGNVLTAVMMNPSNAAHNQTDKTVEQLIEVAKNHGCHALYIVNVSSFIGGTSSKLNNAQFDFELANWTFISNATAAAESSIVFLGWGLKGQQGILRHQKRDTTLFKDTFRNVSNKLFCYDVLKSIDKKYINKSMYYLPHPRPQLESEKYRFMPIRHITDLEFEQLFNC